jgi:hypothetical protein
LTASLKTCIKCEQPKQRSEFYKHHRNSDGLEGSCKRCRISSKFYKRPDPEKRVETVARYLKKNPHLMRAFAAAARAKRFGAMPSWVDRKAIYAIYKRAIEVSRETGIPHEVDHIVPLRGHDVSGLHVPWNLQILPDYQNRYKGHKTWLA